MDMHTTAHLLLSVGGATLLGVLGLSGLALATAPGER